MNNTIKDYDSELDFSYFRFDVNDEVSYQGNKGIVKKSLDETIFIEFEQESNNDKVSNSQWVEIENKCLELLSLRNNI